MLASFSFPHVGKLLVDATPEPLSVMVAGELVAVLTTKTLPVTLPETAGANVTFMVVEAPGLRMSPIEMPLTLKPAPERVTLEMLTMEPPELVSVTDCVLLLPTFTFPKARLEALELSWPGDVTVRVAALLVTLATELLTTTVNCAPLSELVVAGVV